ncbi:Uncharacterized membrane protein [Frankineae bacterium MT45]|nr:Uncharacterized membrane protein [Frankineae bacterium MT45]
MSYLRATMIGLATGCRSQSGLAALAWTPGRTASGSADSGGISGLLDHRWSRASTGLALGGELIGDKVPSAPSRSTPGPLAGRLFLGGVAAYALAERTGASRLLSAALGVAGSAVTSLAGPRYRALAASRVAGITGLPSDLPGAVAEDVFAMTVAWRAVR